MSFEVKDGDLWSVGRHFLLCGCACEKESYHKLGGLKKPNLCLTDPPFGSSSEEPDPTETLYFFEVIPSLMVVMTFPVDLAFHQLADATKKSWILARELTWVRQTDFRGVKHYKQAHVPILIFVRRRQIAMKAVTWQMGDHSTVFALKDDHLAYPQPKPRPMLLWKKLIEHHSQPGEVILDPFVGSGTTIFACEATQRTCYAIEINPDYCSKILRKAHAQGFAVTLVESKSRGYKAAEGPIL